MKIGFCGSSNKYSILAFKSLIKAGYDVKYFLTCEKQNTRLIKYCEINDIKLFYNQKDVLEEKIDVELLISFTYQKLIKDDLINSAKKAINFHPAPLPEFRGKGTNMHAILQGRKEWGVTCHFISSTFDTGDIIEVLKFSIPENVVFGKDLSDYSWNQCIQLMKKITKKISLNRNIKSTVQGAGNYYDMNLLNEKKIINMSDSNDEINRKINAFWYLPYEGAYILINGEKFYLINSAVINSIKNKKRH